MSDSVLSIEIELKDIKELDNLCKIIEEENKIKGSSSALRFVTGREVKFEYQNYDMNANDNLLSILTQISPMCAKNPIASIWIDSVDETIYYTVTNNKLYEYESLKDAQESSFRLPEQTSSVLTDELFNNASLIKITPKKSNTDVLFNEFSQYINEQSLQQKFELLLDKDWDRDFSTVRNSLCAVVDKGKYIVLVLNLRNTELFPESTEESNWDKIDMLMEAVAELSEEIYDMEKVKALEMIIRNRYERGNKCIFAVYDKEGFFDYGCDTIKPNNGWL
jgi:hypothetical protein